MELSLRLDTLGMVEVRYLRGRERYRDWPQFQLLAASRQASISAYMTHDIAEQLHDQILAIESAIGLDVGFDDDTDEDTNGYATEDADGDEEETVAEKDEKESSSFSPAFAQSLKQLNELARQRLPDAGTSSTSGDLPADFIDPTDASELVSDDDDAIELLQDAFLQMMEVVRELADEVATDALKITGRLKCTRTAIEFAPRFRREEDIDDDEETDPDEESVEDVDTSRSTEPREIEFLLLLQLYEDGHSRVDDMPAVELQLDVDDFERLHETLDIAFERERRGRRRRQY
ncbi:MAG TPA: hypothetical protein DHW02_05160 [Ktedonobacter sp.]|nr:hypothetical protein [Ktedonobacter sp.]